MEPITTAISTNNNLDYLKLAIHSVRKNCYYKNQPILVYAENCTDGTNEWLEMFADELGITYFIENNEVPRGIGGGMDYCANECTTKFINFIHSDMYVGTHQDLELLKLYDDNPKRLVASSFRLQPKIFAVDPDYRPGTLFADPNQTGLYAYDFREEYVLELLDELARTNDVCVRKGGGAGFFCETDDYRWIGGNDPLFAPASFDDMDLFIRMQLEGFDFKMTSKSWVWHFSARGSHFRDEAKDNLNSKSVRQSTAENNNRAKFFQKWGQLPESDEMTFVKPIHNESVETRLPLL